MPCALGLLLLFLLSAAELGAQVLYAVPKDQRVEKRYREHLTTFKGRQVLIGEPKQGIQCTDTAVTRTGGAEAKNEMFVADPADPAAVPYEWDDGKRVKSRKGTVVAFAGDDFPEVNYVDRLQTLQGLADEYLRRVGEIDALEVERDGGERGSGAWFGRHVMMLARLDRLESWLVNNGYPEAAKKLSRRIAKEKRDVAKDATAAREKRALESIERGEVPPKLIEASQAITGGRAKFGVVESQHLRIIYLTDLPDARAEQAIRLGEEVIEGFRKDFVDPYRDEGFKDYIPDGRFLEFFFGPEDLTSFERFRVEFYGASWPERNKERELKMSGSNLRQRRDDADHIAYWKLAPATDVEGTVAHRLGHVLANLHYARGGAGTRQDWLEEALGYYLSFGHLGRNSVICFQWSEPTYAKPAEQEGEKTVQAGVRGYLNELALAQVPPIDALAIKSLAEMTDADFGKAWSFFDFVTLRLGLDGQVWLRDTCSFATGNRGDFMKRWRAATEQRFPVRQGEDVFRALEERWRQYATSGQRKD